jgi:DNA mismatch repair protein MutS
MVEMLETANIINNATPRSLIILDEIGRGTSTFDGMAIAWAIIEYLHNNHKIAAKTLFATHFHQLTNLSSYLPKIKNYSIAVKEYNDQILFLRKIIPGPSDKSYGIQVAKLAGLPEKLISRSKEILSQLEQPKLNNQKTNENNLQLQLNQTKTIEKEKINELIEKLKSIDINSITPIEAFNLLLNIINNINKTNK